MQYVRALSADEAVVAASAQDEIAVINRTTATDQHVGAAISGYLVCVACPGHVLDGGEAVAVFRGTPPPR